MNVKQNWSSLAAAVINMAINDLGKSRKKLERNPGDRVVRADVEELERFFRSEWFGMLLSLSGIEADEKKIRETIYGC